MDFDAVIVPFGFAESTVISIYVSLTGAPNEPVEIVFNHARLSVKWICYLEHVHSMRHEGVFQSP